MLSIFNSTVLTSKTDCQKIKLIYNVAPLSEYRKYPSSVCLHFQAAGENGTIVLPYPKHMRNTTALRNHINESVLGMVSSLLKQKNYSAFELHT